MKLESHERDAIVALLVAAALIFFLRCNRANADDLLPACKSALSACDSLRTADQAVIDRMKDQVRGYKKAVKDTGGEVPIVVWTVVSGALGGALAGEVANGKSGLAPGGMVGAGVGLIIGLIVGDGK